MGKLTGLALRWYRENLHLVITWENAEQSLRNRFKKYTTNCQLWHDFFRTRQAKNQSVIAFYENVIKKYRKGKRCITEEQLISVLQTGVKKSLRVHLTRKGKDITNQKSYKSESNRKTMIRRLNLRNNHSSNPLHRLQQFNQPKPSTRTSTRIITDVQDEFIQILKPKFEAKEPTI